MNKYLFVAFLFLILLNLQGNSQSREVIEVSEALRKPVLFGQVVESWPTVVGPQFFLPEWAEGSVLLNDGRVAEKIWLKYDALNDALIWFNQEANRQVVLDREVINAFSLLNGQTGETDYFRQLPLRNFGTGDRNQVFAQVLTEGSFSLYVLRQVEQRGVRERRHQRVTVEVPVIEPRPLYVILHPDEKITQFRRPRRSAVTGLIPGKKKELQHLLSGQGLRFSHEDDLKRAIELINESSLAQ